MSIVTMFRAALRQVPASQRLSATLRTAAGAETSGTALEGVLDDESRTYEQNGTVHRAALATVLLAEGLDFAPALGMRCTLGAQAWTVLGVRPMEPTDAGAPIAYELVLDR